MLRHRVLVTLVAATMLFDAGFAKAGGLMLRYGFYLEGAPRDRTAINLDLVKRPRNGGAVYTLTSVEDEVRRYMFPLRLADRDTIDESINIGLEEFPGIDRDPLTDNEPSAIGMVDQTVPFESRGGRVLNVTTQRGPIEIAQQASSIRSDRISVVSRNLWWDYGLLTEELSDKSLLALLDSVANPASLQDMLSRVSFLVQADRFELAQKEMLELKANFPEAAERAAIFEEKLYEFYGRKAMRELKHRREAGQHRAALGFAKTLRDHDFVSIETVDQADLIVEEYGALLERRDTIIFQLGELEGEIEEDDAKLVRPLRKLLTDELHADNIDRLDSFLDSVDDITLKPDEKLALAYSAWVGGRANATTNLADAIDDWALRAAVLDYARADNKYDRRSRWPAIDSLEGVDIRDLEAMIPLLPPIDPPADLSTVEPAIGHPLDRETSSGVGYTLQLPPEYSGARSYPVLIVLHAGGLTAADEVRWWAGTADRPDLASTRGYIVAAPHYLADDEQPSGAIHDRIFDVLIDLRKRFRVDSNRVFLAGHGLGADVVWDVGFARPMPWAGLVPIGGRIPQSAKVSWENGAHTAIYAVNGGLDARTFTPNAATLQRLIEKREAKPDIILCEYMNRGHEPYGAEKPRIFDWLALHSRAPIPREIEAKVHHPSDTDWTWYHAAPLSALKNPPQRGEPATQMISANVTLGNRIYVGTQPATLKLSPELVDFEERVRIRYGSRTISAQLLEPSMKTMLDDFSERFDRERLFWTELEVP